MAKLYPIGIQNFEKIRNDGYCYVDKTALIYQMAKTGSYYFLSRPRRFGKSLLLSTIEAYFQGKQALFDGLALSTLEKEWLQYPILHIDLNTEKYDSEESLENKLNTVLTQWEKIYGKEPAEKSLYTRFEGIIRRAREKTGMRTVILIDEYDKPILQAIGNDSLQQTFRDIMKAFYGALKSMDGHIQFAMLTGVTKFGKVSIFSDLNNLIDISMDHRYTEICGITEQEMHRYFENELHELAHAQKITYERTCEELKERYDGYHFTENSPGIYNPFSLLNTLDKTKFGSYWFETGTPTYLVKLLKQHSYDLEQMTSVKTDGDVLNSIDPSSTNPVPIIYQSGYLTIKAYDPEFGLYTLGFPNREVEEGFMKFFSRPISSPTASKP